MIAGISESGGYDGKGGLRGNTGGQVRCMLPTLSPLPWSPFITNRWFEKNVPNEFANLTAENSQKQEAGPSEGQGTAGEEEEKKKQKRGGRDEIKLKKEDNTTKGWYRVCGLATLEIDPKERFFFLFAQKFSCGASVTGEDEIIIQGDFIGDILDVIQEKSPDIDDDGIEDLGEAKN
uniref:SUI1 domain-containing protein n=1 Tax=Ursus americanus TaxID=9643 RepID=A0A452R6A6_URSAM